MPDLKNVLRGIAQSAISESDLRHMRKSRKNFPIADTTTAYSRTEAFLSMTNPLGQDVLIRIGLRAKERTSGLYFLGSGVVGTPAH